MEPEDTMPEAMCESPGGMRRQRLTISSTRRRELMRFAEQVASQVEERIKSHERCLFRQMVESLIGGEP